jgi:hypothetical protein
VSRSFGGLALLLIGSLGLIGFLTGNLDRWLAFLFSPGGAPLAAPASATAPSSAPAPTSYQRTA